MTEIVQSESKVVSVDQAILKSGTDEESNNPMANAPPQLPPSDKAAFGNSSSASGKSRNAEVNEKKSVWSILPNDDVQSEPSIDVVSFPDLSESVRLTKLKLPPHSDASSQGCESLNQPKLQETSNVVSSMDLASSGPSLPVNQNEKFGGVFSKNNFGHRPPHHAKPVQYRGVQMPKNGYGIMPMMIPMHSFPVNPQYRQTYLGTRAPGGFGHQAGYRDSYVPMQNPRATMGGFMMPPYNDAAYIYPTPQYRPLPYPMFFSDVRYYAPFQAYPYTGMPEPPMAPLSTRLLNQIEYYFSDENLVKDFYLKSKMDENGWVPITLIAEFRRVKSMTENIQIILDSLIASRTVEVQDRKVRRRDQWARWIRH